jgi:hypothetical protein
MNTYRPVLNQAATGGLWAVECSSNGTISAYLTEGLETEEQAQFRADALNRLAETEERLK